MTDKEKVLKGLDIHRRSDVDCSERPYEQHPRGECIELLCKDAIKVLTYSGPEEPIRKADGNYYCLRCGVKLTGTDKESKPKHKWGFCRGCGQAVKWRGEW